MSVRAYSWLNSVLIALLCVGCKGGAASSTADRKGFEDTAQMDSPVRESAVRRPGRSEIPALHRPANAAYDVELQSGSFGASTRPQQTCPIDGNPLGNSGTPVTVTLKGEPVFVCCQGCAKKAQTNPDKYLSRVRTETASRD
jgi:hypothetical protein